MNPDNTPTKNDDRAESQASPRPRKLNRILIALGALAFALIVTDRVMEAFEADDVPEEVAVTDSVPTDVADQTADSQVSTEEPTEIAADIEHDILEQLPMPEAEALVKMENLFGSPVVLVSASEPSYVVTADERRFDVGGVVDDTTTLAGVTSHQLIFDQSGDLLVISLPEPVMQ